MSSHNYKQCSLLILALLFSLTLAQTWPYPIIDVVKTVEMEDSVTLPNIVRFNVTVFHWNLTDGPAVDVTLTEGDTDFKVYWGNNFIGPSLTDPNFKVTQDKVMTWTYDNLTNTEVMFLSYMAQPYEIPDTEGKKYYIQPGVNYYNASVVYRPTIDNVTYPEPSTSISGPCCVNVLEEEESSVFLDYGFTVLALVCGFVVGAGIVILILFIITKVRRKTPFGEQVHPYNSIERADANDTKSGYKSGGGSRSIHAMLTDISVAFSNAYDKCQGTLGKFGEGSIVALLTIQDKLKMLRKMNDEDIDQTLKIEQDLEKERCNAMINATSMLVDGLRKNGDLDRGTAERCGSERDKKIKEMEKKGDQKFRQELEKLLKHLNGKHRSKIEQLQDKQEEDVIKTRAQTSNLSPVEQREVMDMLEKQHSTEMSELLYTLKLEQDEAVERQRTEAVVQRRMKIREIQQEYIQDIEVQGKLTPQQLDWLMQEHFKQQAAIDKLYDDEKARARMSLEEKIARRRALMEKHEVEEENESDMLNTIAMQSLSMVQSAKKDGVLTASEAKAMSREVQQQMIAIKEKMEAEKERQMQELNKKLTERKKQRIEALAKKQQQEVGEVEKKHAAQMADAACDPMNIIEVKQTMLSHHRSEMIELEGEIDMEHSTELNSISQELMSKTKETLFDEKEKISSRLQREGLSDAKIQKLIRKHHAEIEDLERTQAEEKAKQMHHFKKRLTEQRNEWAQRRQEEQNEQDQLREHEENVVRKLMDNQVSLSEEERNKILKEHEIQMVKLDNGLALRKLQQKKLLEEKLGQKRAAKMEKLEKKQNIELRKSKRRNASDTEEDDEHDAELQLLKKQAEDRLNLLTGEDLEVENELAEIQDAMVQERAGALKEQELELAAMIAKLQMEKANEMAKIEEQEKAIHHLKANLMDDLNEKGVLSNPECQRVIDLHQEEQENLQEKLNSQRAKQEKQLKRRLQERLVQKEEQIARMQEAELKSAGSGHSTASKLRRAAMMSRHMVEMEKFRNRMEKEISQTLEDLKHQNEKRKKNAIQAQELHFLNGMVRLGKIDQEELSNVVHMLLPNKTENEIEVIMNQLLEGCRAPAQGQKLHRGSLEGNSTLEERVLATTLSQIDDETLNESMRSTSTRKTNKKTKGRKSLPPLRKESRRPDPVGRLSPDGYNSDNEPYGVGRASKLPPLERQSKKKVSRLRRNSADDNYSF